MMLAWMAYAVMVGALVALAGVGAESVARASKVPVRFVWSGAIVLTIGLALFAPLRRPVPAESVSTVLNVASATTSVAVKMSLLASIEVTVRDFLHAIATPVTTLSSIAARYAVRGEMLVIVLWAVASLVALLTLVAVYARYARRRREWPALQLFGERVRVAPSEGPAVMGIAPPEIVVPQWVLLRDALEQQLVIAHEREHVRARDPWLLLAGCVAVAVMPWNAALWFMWSRLRLAVELDCDARVLQSGVRKPEYGQLLLELSEQRATLLPLVPAFAFGTSHLEQRLVAMTSRPARFRMARRVASCSVVAVALVAACRSELPTAQQVEAMDISTVQAQLPQLKTTGYTVDGKAVSEAEATALKPTQIASISIVKTPAARNAAQINILTKAQKPVTFVADTMVLKSGGQLMKL